MGNILYVGVDVAKVSLAGGLWFGQHGEDIGLVSNDETGFEQLAEQVEQAQQSYQAEQVHLIVEPTAGYELQLVQFAYQRGWWVSIVHPLTVRDWIKGLGQRAKTDRLDGRMMARYGAERQPRRWHPLPETITALESLLSRKYDLEQMLRQERNRLEMAQVRPTTAAAVRVNLATMIATLESSLAEIEAAIADLLNQHLDLGEQAQRLDEIPGIGSKIVLPLLVMLHRWDRLTQGQGTGKGLTALVGLDPQTQESGSSVRKHAVISKMGNPNLRRLLFMGALGAIRGDNPLSQFYQGLIERGKPKMVALVACAHKLLLWAWAVFRTGEHFDPARCTNRRASLLQTP